MTREEAIDRLKEARAGHKEFLSVETLNMAIKALEQELVYYPPCIDCNKKMDEIRKAYDNMTTKALEQEPFINKPCVSSGVCEHDKNKVLDKIRVEIDEHIEFNMKMNYMGIVSGLALAKVVIDKYKAEIEPQERNDK